jgi:FMN phosphatase YigB (HAD superfamily)
MNAHRVAFLVDVDNTLLDNDGLIADLRAHLARELGEEPTARYFALNEALRAEGGFVDYLGAFQRLRLEAQDDAQRLLVAQFLLDYPFASRLFPGTLDVLKHLRSLGTTAILSDGDAVFQPRKIHRSGLWDAVRGEVLIYVHKERMLDLVLHRYPAAHYVMIDDKPLILAAMKRVLEDRLTTVFVRQGHYAFDPAAATASPANYTVERIADVLALGLHSIIDQEHAHVPIP